MTDITIDLAAGWQVNERDFRRGILGREDGPENVEIALGVVSSLRGRATRDHATARRAQGALLAARLRSSLTPPARARERELETLLEEQQRVLLEHRATIDRLLAYVPARRSALPEARLRELVETLDAVAKESFPAVARTTLLVVPEDDSEAEACHRLTLIAHLGCDADHADLAAVIAAEKAVHIAFARATTVDERRAVNLLIETTFADA